MDFSIHKENKNVIIKLKGPFDAEVAPKLKNIFNQLVDKISGDVLIDLKPVIFMDSSGAGAIIHIYKALKSRQKRVFIIGAEWQPMGLIAMLKINRIIPCLETMQDYKFKYSNSQQVTPTKNQPQPIENKAQAEDSSIEENPTTNAE